LKEECAIYHTSSAGETVDLGRQLGGFLKRGDVISLAGELGSGKTWFTKGVGSGLGIARNTVITSPSFSLVNEYEGRYTLFHLDAYRLESLADFLAAGLDEYFYQDGVVVMEWADLWPEILPDHRLKVEFVITDEHSRKITMSGYDPRAVEILKKMGTV
jgi:tRNA threonylcarbamoyladenosine biosynthesis protein TsaE